VTEINIEGITGQSTILVGESWEALSARIVPGRTVIISDENVQRLYGNHFPDCPVILIGQGEEHKTLETVQGLYRKLLGLGLDRSGMIVGIGGGIVCDVAGYVAATYLRGVRFGSLATTLLAQVDASVGGKTGVNCDGFKNMVGIFRQPEFVICDLTTLASLPPRELSCGFAEIVKHGAIADADYFTFLERHTDLALTLDPPVMTHVVTRSVEIKAAVVRADETEQGLRRHLNFGHTLGHAYEKTTPFNHGEAVSAGMASAARLSVAQGLLPEADRQRLTALLRAYGLPLAPAAADSRQVLEALAKDKKKEGDQIHFVLLEAIGRAVVRPLPLAELNAFFSASPNRHS
jgi:3-dehydroquinate synthase